MIDEKLTIYTHFNGSLIGKYCQNDYQIKSYITPNDPFEKRHTPQSIALVIDFRLLYTMGFTQHSVSVLEGFQDILDAYYKYIEHATLCVDKILVIGLKTQINSIGHFDHCMQFGYSGRVRQFSTRVEKLLGQKCKGVYLSHSSNRTYREQDYKMAASLGAAHDSDLFKLAGRSIDLFSRIASKSKKAIVFDLDNTLWRGVIGEGVQHTSLGSSNLDDLGYSLLRDYARAAYETGAFTAICSKNDIDVVKEELGRVNCDDMLNYFTVAKINWKNKLDNIQDIAKDLNIGLDTLVFVDDNPREIDNITRNCPEVTVVDASHGPWYVLEHLENEQYFKRHFLLDDDLFRNQSIAARLKHGLHQGSGTIAYSFDHTAELYECDVSIPSVQARLEQLSLKTNQFNLTTRRLTWKNIQNLMANNQRLRLLVYGARDKYGDLGIVGYLLYDLNNKTATIYDWVMSCRAFSLKLENQALEKIAYSSTDKIQVQYEKTERNLPVLSFLEDTDFLIDIVDKSEIVF